MMVRLSAACLLFGLSANAADVRGHVYDKATREQLTGAVITIQPSGGRALTRLDGSFLFKGPSQGS